MKNSFKLLGIIAITAVILFAMASCSDIENEDILGKWKLSDSSTIWEFHDDGDLTENDAIIGKWETKKGKIIYKPSFNFLNALTAEASYTVTKTQLVISKKEDLFPMPAGTYTKP